ncbi:hypothetical protein LJC63_10080 [Ruminococcaceae bacterium OttesenSCG-928-L11]|nr:hypothetical protein [Ruminococcaceae bacterium OttesenSCG-928-L11]
MNNREQEQHAIDRDRILARMADGFRDDKRVNACWVEGSIGLGIDDCYADIDLWLDVDDGHEQAVMDDAVAMLSQLGQPDFLRREDHPHPKIFQTNLHIAGMSPYLLVEICIQSRSRGSEGCTFVEGDVAELPKVLFDKCGVVSIIPPPPPDKERLTRVYRDVTELWSQRAKVVKYLHRGLYLEAYAYYGRYVREQLVTLARLVYTPRHWDYGLVHISHHLPATLVRDLEPLYQIANLDDIELALVQADRLFERLDREAKGRYAFLTESKGESAQ